MNSRTVYSIIGVFGDVGGVISTFAIIFSIFLAPYSEMCFRFKAIQEMCMVEVQEQVQKINFTIGDKVVYYLNLGCCLKNRMKMIENGNDVIDKELDVIELLITVR